MNGSMDKTVKCLLMGFYDRHNIGDDTYKIIIPYLLPSCNIECISCDDVKTIDEDVEMVLVGGGDLVNEYFMNKVQQLLKSYKGRVYGVSLGIPFTNCLHYLHLFDHVFVRSKHDLVIASKEIGVRNVSYLPDFSVALHEIRLLESFTSPQIDQQDHTIKVGVCLAQPLFYNNPKKTVLLDNLCNALKSFAEKADGHVKFILIAFNSNIKSNQECDYVINNHIQKRLSKDGVDVTLRHDITKPIDMLHFFKTSLDMCLCVRYHSVMFSIIADIPFVPLYVSQKINNVLQDIQYPDDIACTMPCDSRFRPTFIDTEKLCNALIRMSKYVDKQEQKPYQTINCTDATIEIKAQITDTIVTRRPYASIISRNNSSSFIDVLSRCKLALCKYLNIEPQSFQEVLHRVGELNHDTKTPLEIARFLCYNITGQIHHPCVWGLSDNLQKTTFKLYDALKYVYDETELSNRTRGVSYYPSIPNFNRRALIHVDFVFSNDFTKYHRSGWSYVVGGLMNLDAAIMLKQSDVFVDTYVDRSFHWGKDIMKTLGELPYTKPWYGFIHHTFDTTHSINNCCTLFEQEDFLTSLQTCKGLFTLTQYLKNKVDTALREKEIANVPVHVLYHPMEFVDNNFTMEKFLNNTAKKVVQIGAWLRNPYAIYQMVLPVKRDFDIAKAHLRGTEMDLYFAPPNFLDAIAKALLEQECGYLAHTSGICRGEATSYSKQVHPYNKYSQGVLNLLANNHNSVTVLEKLSNQGYDDLLAENIILLNLVDCSAVNTVIECIVRNTPLILNRHPALEELLGEDYPGFYSTLQEASDMCVSLNTVERMHNHMKLLDKTKYKLENFITDFQEILVNGKTSRTYNIVQTSKFQNNMLPVKHFSGLYRFLPPRYMNLPL